MAQRELQVKRLMTLAAFLAPIKEGKFDLDSWAAHNGDLDKHDLNVLGLNKLEEKPGVATVCPTSEQLGATCGTTACALGWAGTIPEFQKAGLTLDFKVRSYRDYGDSYTVEEATVRFRQEGKRTVSDFDAGAKFFGLTDQESHVLFSPSGYDEYDPQPVHVVAKIATILWNRQLFAEAGKLMTMPEVKKAGINFRLVAVSEG